MNYIHMTQIYFALLCIHHELQVIDIIELPILSHLLHWHWSNQHIGSLPKMQPVASFTNMA